MAEIFSEVQKSLKKIAGGELLPSGIVLTGGGSSLPGLVEYTKQRFKLPCRLGSIREINGIDNPEFVTSAGLLLYGFDMDGDDTRVALSEGGGILKGMKRVLKHFIP